MYTKIKAAIAVFIVFSAVACQKENTGSLSSTFAKQSATTAAVAAPASFHIGQSYHGGIIFYIDSTGAHGLIAAKTDQGVQNAWYNGKNIATGATATKVGSGLDNTNKIVNAQGTTGTYAALLCLHYVSGSFKNWYLPSKAELNLMYKQKAVLSLDATNYWSSSEASKSKAWDQEFGGGFQFKDTKNFTLHVRAISSF